MSLIHEALRKARREQEEQDARGVAYARGLTGQRRRHGLGTGILLGALLAVLVGGAVGLGLWLGRGDHGGALPPAPGSAAAATQAAGASSIGPTGSQPEATPVGTAAAEAPTASVPATTAPSGDPGQPPLDQRTPGADQPGPPAAEHRPSPPAERATPRETRGPGGERVFHTEADLGYASLSVDYIVARPHDPFVRINGMDLRVGNTVEGFTVEAITPTEVRLRDERGPLILKVP
jgi:hypothetical protein